VTPSPLEILRRSGANLSRALRRSLAGRTLTPDGVPWVCARVKAPLAEVPLARLSRDPAPSLLELLETLETAAGDPDVGGVFLELSGGPVGFSKTLSLHRAVERLRAAGKPVAVYAETFEAESLLLACAASRIWMPETGRVFLVGLRTDSFHFRDLLERVDVRPEVVRIGSHKTAAESLTRDRMSEAQREQLGALLDDRFETLVDGIARGRGLDPEAVRGLIDRGPYTARRAVEAGLIDACLYGDEVDEQLDGLSAEPGASRPGPRRAARVEGGRYHALRAADPGWLPVLRNLPRIAYVVGQGAIHSGGGPRGISSEPLLGLLEGLSRDPDVRGVVLRVDSPGGDALASDLLWRALRELAREKTLVVSMGEVAASGGYYLASAADAIFAEAATITGSIGVIGGKLNLEGLYHRLGIGRDTIERGARAGLLSEARAFTADERHAVRDEMAAVYGAFVDRVAGGRGLSPAAVERVAQGRVWSGLAASRVGLVDRLGGPLEALREARRRAGLRLGDGALVEIHPRHPIFPGLSGLLRWIA
jgi:protease-4